LARWDERGRQGEDDLRIVVSFGEAGSRIGYRWSPRREHAARS
jgi:hypothetical protein